MGGQDLMATRKSKMIVKISKIYCELFGSNLNSKINFTIAFIDIVFSERNQLESMF